MTAEIRTASGVKRAIHFGAPGHELCGFYYPPAAGTWRDAGVVLVAPLGTDLARSDRAYRHLAERLAARGLAVLRYDHFGTGDSGGDDHTPGLVAAWRGDVGRAVAELRARSGAQRIAAVGLRAGATLAMAGARELDALVLWNPSVSGQAFVTEVVKLHKVYARIEPLMANAGKLDADGEEALGLFLARETIRDLGAIDLLASTHRPAAAALVIEGGAARDALVARLDALGVATEMRAHPGQKFLTTVPHRAALPEEVIESIASWLTARYPIVEGAAPMRPEPPELAGPHGEHLLVFGDDRPRFGILTPAPGPARSHRPPIILANAGCVSRAGPHRNSVQLARRWAAAGFDVLRIDLSGIGDTPAPAGTVENVTYPPGGLADLDAALHALGRPRAIIAGLCSGGDYAFQLGARDPRVASAIIMNPRTFCMLDLQAVESAAGEPPPPGATATSAASDTVPATLRAMAERGVDTFLLVSRADPGIAYVDAHFGADMAALAEVPQFTRVDIDGSDHTFTPATAQAAVSDRVTAHLLARYP